VKDPYDILCEKEIHMSCLRIEIAALRLVIGLLDQEDDYGAPNSLHSSISVPKDC
jgi:hypothetical protein